MVICRRCCRAGNSSSLTQWVVVKSELERLKVLSSVEMVSGFMELVALQLAEQPEEIQPRWKAYIVDGYNSSVVLREHLATCTAWYADDFLHLLPKESMEASAPRTADKTKA